MIGSFARIFRDRPRALDQSLVDEKGAPPERFVEKISEEGGDIYVAPVLDGLREALRKHRDPSTPAPQELTADKGKERAS